MWARENYLLFFLVITFHLTFNNNNESKYVFLINNRYLVTPLTFVTQETQTRIHLIALLTNGVFIPLPHDVVKQLIDSKYYFCSKSVKFIPLEKACDGKEDCSGAEDESSCVMQFGANSTFPRKSPVFRNTHIHMLPHTHTPTYLLTDMRSVSTDITCVSCFKTNKPNAPTSPSFLCTTYSYGNVYCLGGWIDLVM